MERNEESIFSQVKDALRDRIVPEELKNVNESLLSCLADLVIDAVEELDMLEELKNVRESLLSCLVYVATGDIKDEEVSISCQKKLANSVAALEGLCAQLEDSLGVPKKTQN